MPLEVKQSGIQSCLKYLRESALRQSHIFRIEISNQKVMLGKKR